MSHEQRSDIEAALDERAARLERVRAAMVREAEGMRDSELAHVDNHPGDLGTDVHDEELDETALIFFEEERRRIAEARRALAIGPATGPAGTAGARSSPIASSPCPRRCAASRTSAASRAGTGSRPGTSPCALS